MTFEIAVVLILLVVAIILFATEKIPVDLVAIFVMVTLILTRVVSPEEGISGFSNVATITVGAMFVLSAGLYKTGGLNFIGSWMASMGRKSYWLGLIVMMVGIGIISAFINNTAAVAILMPIVIGVARDTNISPSKMLMPLSFASIFGGVCTLIGTSTNILVNSIALDHGLPALGMFEFASFGVVILVTGTLYMMIAGNRLIPARRSTGDLTQSYGMGDYLTEIILLPNAASVGKAVKDSALVHDLDVDILDATRGGKSLWLTPDTILHANDLLLVRGNVEQIGRLQKKEGVVFKSKQRLLDSDLDTKDATLVEAVIAPNSMLEGKSLKEVNFRNVFGATTLAIRHRGEVMHEKLGRTPLHSGDVLLIDVLRHRMNELKNNSAFIVVSEVGLPEFRRKKILPAILIVCGVVLAAALGVVPIVTAAITGCILLVLTRCISLEEAYNAIEWRIIFLLAGVLALGIALEKSGGAHILADYLVSGVGALGPRAILSILFFMTMLLTNLMSNNATAVLLAPIAIDMANSLQVDSRPFLMAVAFAASLSFMSPVGYQTNTLIYAPGQYRFSDFIRVGTPLSLLFWILGTFLIPYFWPF